MTEDLELPSVLPPYNKVGQKMETKGERKAWSRARNPALNEALNAAAPSTKCCPQPGVTNSRLQRDQYLALIKTNTTSTSGGVEAPNKLIRAALCFFLALLKLTFL